MSDYEKATASADARFRHLEQPAFRNYVFLRKRVIAADNGIINLATGEVSRDFRSRRRQTVKRFIAEGLTANRGNGNQAAILPNLHQPYFRVYRAQQGTLR